MKRFIIDVDKNDGGYFIGICPEDEPGVCYCRKTLDDACELLKEDIIDYIKFYYEEENH